MIYPISCLIAPSNNRSYERILRLTQIRDKGGKSSTKLYHKKKYPEVSSTTLPFALELISIVAS